MSASQNFPFFVKPDPTINAQHSANVESAIGAELYETDDPYTRIDPIAGNEPTGQVQHSELLSDE